MVDTTDSKSVASNRVRVQVSSPVELRTSRITRDVFLCYNSGTKLLQSFLSSIASSMCSLFMSFTPAISAMVRETFRQEEIARGEKP